MNGFKLSMAFLMAIIFVMSVSENAYALSRLKEIIPLQLTEKSDIQDALALDQYYTETVMHVGKCIKNGGDRKICRCNNLENYHSFQTMLETTLEKHPDWKEQMLIYPFEGKDEHMFVDQLQKSSRTIDTLQCPDK